jgi:phosphohistidine phosphatase SixA
MLLLLRHGSAGSRKRWTGDDRIRPLDKRGRGQALALAEVLVPFAPERILSSGFVRCRETVEPLAERLGLEIEERAELEPDATPDDLTRLLLEVTAHRAVVCTHREPVEGWLGRSPKKGGALLVAAGNGQIRPVGALDAP